MSASLGRPADWWGYQGAEAGRSHKLTPYQRGYAITLRRQLAGNLASHAAARARVAQDAHLKTFWMQVAKACIREQRRMSRASERLAQEARR